QQVFQVLPEPAQVQEAAIVLKLDKEVDVAVGVSVTLATDPNTRTVTAPCALAMRSMASRFLSRRRAVPVLVATILRSRRYLPIRRPCLHPERKSPDELVARAPW
ncbi:MAG: hypothetical protein ACRDSN_11540, partial [Pseudonocardiaceae bacterium]